MVDTGVARRQRGGWLRTYLLLAVLLPLELHAAIELQLPTILEQGRLIQAELVVSGQSPDLHTLSLQPLEGFFHIEEAGEVLGTQTRQGQHQQRRRLKLVPIHSGIVSLPEWGVEKRRIMAARDPKTREPIQLFFHAQQSSPWQRQQVGYTIEVESPQRFIRLQLDEALDSHWLARLTDAQTELITESPTPRYRHRYLLWLFPLQAGTQTLQLPALSYLHDGVASHRFYPPPMTLKVKALPAYLPASTQVGNVSMELLSSNYAWLRSGDSGELRLQIRAEGVAGALWSLALPELKGDAAIEPLPVTGRLLETVSPDGVTSEYQLSLPFETRANQFWSSQALVLEYFDPVLGKRMTQTLSLRTPWIISTLQWWWLTLLLLGLMFWCVRRVVARIQEQRKMAAAYLQAWELLGSARDATALRQAQGCIAEAEGWPSHVGTDAWLQHWQALMPQQNLSAWQKGIQELCYRGDVDSLPRLRREMLLMLQQRLAWRLSWYRLLSLMGAV
ncbi:MAG: hypothetical protein OEX12_00925 [Gammaproteobacteria bacterium]|nr:hypothetical protein [Gammaproteobacteria bacterium]